MKLLIVANWKMNPQSLTEATFLLDSILRGLKRERKNLKEKEIVICPPFLYLFLLKEKIEKLKLPNLKIGAQNIFWEEKGAFTGEISPLMLKNFGCQYVIVGHSERREYLRESDEMINKKLKAALQEKLRPILCVGERAKERKAGKTFKILENQLKTNLKSIFNLKSEISNLIIAYEPVWAIGTGNPCDPEKAKEVLVFLKKNFKFPILYGGSVNSENAKNYLKVGFNGLLIGGVSLKEKEFLSIVKSV